jgi:adenosylcobinamide-phosphate synthase
MNYAPLVLSISLLLDLALGEPRGALLRMHPVVLCGSLAMRNMRIGGVLSGVALWFTSVIPVLLLFTLATDALLILNPIVGVLACSYVLKLTYSVNLMRNYVTRIMGELRSGNEAEARILAQDIVRRNTGELDREHLISATVESAAESLVDGVISPILYFTVLGLPGALLQRLANTMDSIVGYRGWPHREVGWFSAKVDTVLNYVPARITGLLIVASSILLGLDWRRALRILRTERKAVGSVNAGWPIAAFAGALGVRLEKPGKYSVGHGHLDVETLERALDLFDTTVALGLTLSLVLLINPAALLVCQL